MKKRIIIRVDGDSKTGYGHIIRCVALAELLAPAFTIDFISRTTDGFAVDQIADTANLISFPETVTEQEEIAFIKNNARKNDIVILDGYHFTSAYRQAIKNIPVKLVCIEDVPAGFYPANAIICPSPVLQKSDFNALPETVFCLGLPFAMLRKAFRQPLPLLNNRQGILVAMGGTDVYCLTPVIVKELLKEGFINIQVIYTNGFKKEVIDELQQIKKEADKQVHLHANVSSEKIRHIMDTVTKAVLPASGILVEALSRGVQVFAGFYAGNQLGFYRWLEEEKLVHPLGDLRLLQPGFVQALKDAGLNKFKGFHLKTASEWQEIIHSL